MDRQEGFDTLDIAPSVLKAIKEMGYLIPTPIQSKAIPVIMEGKELIGTAQTGSGKTGAYGIPIISLMAREKKSNEKRKRIKVLIVAPTRELASQIGDNLESFSKYARFRLVRVFGGVPQSRQVRKLRSGVDILVATPGRLLDLINQGHIKLDHVKYFVLDEADRMLDMGFIDDIYDIMSYLPSNITSLLFSATMPREIKKLAMQLMSSPEKIVLNPEASPVETVSSEVFFVEERKKFGLLKEILSKNEVTKALIFSRTKRGADRLAEKLRQYDFRVDSIHGDKSQRAREKALHRFRTGKSKILVATDIVARGIDVLDISHVINFDMPYEPETYIHRIGRTARAGRHGVAISFCKPSEFRFLNNIERLINQKINRAKNSPTPTLFGENNRSFRNKKFKLPSYRRSSKRRK